SQQAVQLAENLLIDFSRVVRIDSRAGVELWNAGLPVELAADFKRPAHPGCLLSNTNGQHCAHSRLPRASKHRRPVFRVAFTVQMGVGIDQHGSLNWGCREIFARRSSVSNNLRMQHTQSEVRLK